MGYELLQNPLSKNEKKWLNDVIKRPKDSDVALVKMLLQRLQDISALLETSLVQNRLSGNADFSQENYNSAKLEQELKDVKKSAEELKNKYCSAMSSLEELKKELEKAKASAEEKEVLYFSALTEIRKLEERLEESTNCKKSANPCQYPLQNRGRKRLLSMEQICVIVMSDKSNRELAREYKCSEKTIRNYKKQYRQFFNIA